MELNRKRISILMMLWLVLAACYQSSALAAPRNKVENWEKTFGEPNKVICVTIPKAGTHLLIKCLTLLGVKGVTYNYNTEKYAGRRRQDPYHRLTPLEYADRTFARLSYRIKKNKNVRRSFLVHLPFTQKYKPFFDKFTEKNFLMMRDPRDQLISLASTAIEDPLKREDFLHDVLLDLIEGKQRQVPWKPRHGATDMMWTLGTVNFYKAFLKWADEPNFCVIRFENLVGPQGGGNEEAQIQEINKIANHLGVTLTSEQVNYILDNIFGETRTFKQGQARSWVKYFTPEIKDAYKRVPGACQMLIDLGYEQDSNW